MASRCRAGQTREGRPARAALLERRCQRKESLILGLNPKTEGDRSVVCLQVLRALATTEIALDIDRPSRHPRDPRAISDPRLILDEFPNLVGDRQIGPGPNRSPWRTSES